MRPHDAHVNVINLLFQMWKQNVPFEYLFQMTISASWLFPCSFNFTIYRLTESREWACRPVVIVGTITLVPSYSCQAIENLRDHMMTSWNGNILRVTGHLCGEFTGPRWIPRTKANDAELWCFLWSAPKKNGWVNNREAGDLRRHRAHRDVIVMIKYA